MTTKAGTTNAGDLERWRELAKRELKGRDPETLNWTTPEGLVVKPLYTEADLEGVGHLGDLPGSGIVYALTVSAAEDAAALLGASPGASTSPPITFSGRSICSWASRL